jgi:ATP-dependent RNA helicase DDX51/DBP6
MAEVHPLQPLPQPEPASEPAKKPAFAALPAWLTSPIRVSTSATSSFTELGIPKEASKVLQSKGFDHAFAIQAAIIPLLLPRKQQRRGDVLVSAATGSGKTLGYVLPMISDISQTSIIRLRGLIIVPTRDLVYQAHKICEIGASAFAGKGRRRVRVGMACGDMSYKQELAHLMSVAKYYNPAESKKRHQRPNVKWDSSDYETDGEKSSHSENESSSAHSDYIMNYISKVDILVCTPGRLVQHLHETDGFELNYINWLVIDEADRLLNQSYQQFIKFVMASLSTGLKRRITKIVLSATLTRDLGKLSDLKFNKPKLVVLGETDNDNDSVGDIVYCLPETLEESAILCYLGPEKPLHLLHLLQKIIRENTDTQKGALVFANSNEDAMRLSRLLILLDPPIAAKIGTITSIVPISERKKAIQEFKDEKLLILVASDVGSRGLDLPTLRYVINYDIPASPEIYVHRVGRTARAGRKGHAYTLFLRRVEDRPWRKIVNSPSIRRAAGSKGVRTIDSSPMKWGEDGEWYEGALTILGKEAGQK